MQINFTIGELAQEFGVSLRTLRFYEDKGLINPQRQGLMRIYGRRERARIKLILLGKKVGFSLAEIGEMLDLYDLKDGRTTQLRMAISRFGEQVGVLRQQRKDIERAIEELTRTMEVIQGMLDEREAQDIQPATHALQAAE